MMMEADCYEADDKEEEKEATDSTFCSYKIVPCSVFIAPSLLLLKKEFIRPGLHLRPVHADHARPPLQWTLNSVLSAYGNDNRSIRPPLDRGTLKIVSRLLIT